MHNMVAIEYVACSPSYPYHFGSKCTSVVAVEYVACSQGYPHHFGSKFTMLLLLNMLRVVRVTLIILGRNSQYGCY